MYDETVSLSTPEAADTADVQGENAAAGTRNTATLGRKDALKAYLQAMGYPLLFVAFLTDANKPPKVFRVTNAEELKAVMPTLGSLNGHKWNIYAEVNIGSKLNAYGKPARNSEASIRHIRCIVGDVDAKNGVTMEQCREKVDALPLRPSFIVLSGGGEQPYFMLPEPVKATEENRAKARAAGAGLAALLGGDATFSLEHLFRVPGFKNWPDEKKRKRGRVPVTTTIREAAGPTYSLDELHKAFPKPAAPEDILPGMPDPRLKFDDDSDLTGEKSKPFNDLSPEEKDACLAEMLAVPAIIEIAKGGRERWLGILYACARSDAPNAREICRAWSKLGEGQYDEGAFDKDYDSLGPDGAITVGKIILAAIKGGWTPPWHKKDPGSPKPEEGGEPTPDEGGEDDDEGANDLGDKDAKAARVWALRALLIDGRDAKSTEARIKQKWPHLTVTAAEIIAAAQRTTEKWEPGVTRVIDGLKKRITSLDQLNQRFVKVVLPGQPAVVAQIQDAQLLTKEDFATRLEDSVIVTGVDSKGVIKPRDAAGAWRGDCRHRVMKRIVFTSRKAGPECFNLWTDFGVTPKAGKCDLIHQHIHEVICAGRDRENKAFLNLLAWQAQNIGRASRIIVSLYSTEQQVGKGVLLEKILRPMYGLHGLFSADSGKALDRFNDALIGKAYIAFDEACFAGNRGLADKIKSASGTEYTAIEKKGLPVISCPVAVNFFMATNHAHSAHVEWNDARYWILKVSGHRKDDVDYWKALFWEIDHGGIEAFLHDLLARDVSGFVPGRDVPRDNEEHSANKRASDPTHPALWLQECFDSNLWLGSEKWEGLYTASGDKKIREVLPMFDANGACTARLLPHFLLTAYSEWAKAQGRHAQPAAVGGFWGVLADLGIRPTKSNGVRYRTVPPQGTLRHAVRKMLGA